MYLLKKEGEVVFHILLKNIIKQIINNKANNKYTECYDGSVESKFITYLDANNLNGWAMSQYLPHDEFKWLNQKEVLTFV